MALSAAQIVNLACQICKTPGFTQQAGLLLNVVLADLAQLYDFDFIRATEYPLNIDAATAAYALPADHARTREVFYNVNGEIFWVTQMSLEEYDQQFQGPGISNYPTRFATKVETAPHTILFYPPPALPLQVTVRYQPCMPDIPTPETNSVVPWFYNQKLLLKLLCAEVSMLADDDRMQSFGTLADENLRKFLIMDDDKEGYARKVKLDPNTFRPNNSLIPTKSQPL